MVCSASMTAVYCFWPIPPDIIKALPLSVVWKTKSIWNCFPLNLLRIISKMELFLWKYLFDDNTNKSDSSTISTSWIAHCELNILCRSPCHTCTNSCIVCVGYEMIIFQAMDKWENLIYFQSNSFFLVLNSYRLCVIHLNILIDCEMCRHLYALPRDTKPWLRDFRLNMLLNCVRKQHSH